MRYYTDADGHGNCGFTRVGKDPNTIFLNHDCIKRREPYADDYLKISSVTSLGTRWGFIMFWIRLRLWI